MLPLRLYDRIHVPAANDACILGHDGRTPRSLEIRDCALSDASRGCLWYAGAKLTVVNSSFSGFSKHALALATQNGALSLFDVNLFDIAENAILIQSGGAQSHLLSGRYAAASHRPSS